ncbi:MAG: HlyC/CorC family transporter [Flavobacteriales bacterium]|nr:HlyC/CorC family transporter [Flavobacteriales bacterium]
MELIYIATTLILSGFFSGMEIAFISSNRVFLEIEKKQNTAVAYALSVFTNNPSLFITTMLIGNNIALVVYGYYMGDVIMEYIRPYDFSAFTLMILQTIISAIIVILTAEFLPKVFFKIYANSLLKFFAIPAYVLFLILYPLSAFVIWVSDFLLIKVFKSEGDQIQLTFSKNELGNYITENTSTSNEKEIDSEIQIFQNALEFSNLYARDIMTPRTELTAIEIHDSINDLKKLFTSTGYSKILVYKTTIDDIVGYVHSFELFNKPRSIKSIMIPVEFVPETIYIKDLLNILIIKRKSIGVILDEYGGTAGIITIEDIVEELFGDIEDEHDQEKFLEIKLDDESYLFSSRLEVEYLNETYSLDIPESDSYSTLSGYIVSNTEEIPLQGDEIVIGQYQFTIVQASNKLIQKVKIKKIIE